MKPKNNRFLASSRILGVIATTAIVQLGTSHDASAANTRTWVASPTDANWTTAANWGGTVPGINPSANSTNTTDVAQFNAAITTYGGSANPIINDTNRMVGSLLFDTGAGSYVIGAASGAPTLMLGNGLNVTVNGGVTNAQTINAALALHLPSSTNGAHTISNNSSTAGATLTLAGGIVNATNSTRGTAWTLGGTNTGNNTVSGTINITNSGGIASTVAKSGAGTWILSAANTIGGGVTISAGTLAAQNATAFGAATTTINGGTARIDNVMLANAISLNDTGAISGNAGTGSTTGTITVSGTAANVGLFAVGSSDVLSIGNSVANKYTGGQASTVTTVSGSGIVYLTAANNYIGQWAINSGTLRLGNATSLGPASSASVAFGAGTTGKLQLNGNSPTVAGLSTNATPGSAVVENGVSGTGVLTTSISGANTFAGVLQDGTAGTLALTKSGSGTMTLSGAETYTGATTVNAGTLNVTGSLGNTAVTVNTSGTLAGNGTISGSVATSSTGAIAPGNGGVGTLAAASLSLGSGSQLNYDITSTSTLDQINVTTSGGLTINGGQLNINGGLTNFTTNGVYNLIAYSGAIGGTGVSALSVNTNNKNTTTNSYTFGTSGGYVTLTIASTGAVADYWNADADGNWSTGPWTPGTPNAVGSFAALGGGGTTITSPRTITVDGAYTVGTLSLNNASNAYTVAAGTGGGLTLDNGASTSFVTDTAGSHAISVPLVTTANGVVVNVLVLGDTLTVSGDISGGSALTKEGNGTLALTGTNSYTGGTNINGGILQANSDASLGDSAGAVAIGAATLQVTNDITNSRLVSISASGSTISVDSTMTCILDGAVSGTGALHKSGDGVLILGAVNSYTGGSVVEGGTLGVGANNELGDAATGAGVTLNGGTLETFSTFTLDNAGANARAITVSGGSISADAATTLTVSGVIGGSGGLSVTGLGKVSLTNSGNNYTGGTTVNGGTLGLDTNINFGTGGIPLGSGTITLVNGTLSSNMTSGNTMVYDATTPILVGSGTNALNPPNKFRLNSAITGGGTLNMTVNSSISRADFQDDWSGFSGDLNITGSGTARFGLSALGSGQPIFANAGWANTTLSLDGVWIAPTTGSAGNTMAIGALTSAGGTGTLAGGSAGTVTYSVGAKALDTTFAGTITGNANLTKVGSGTLTLTGTNTYTGLTTVSAGTLQIGSGGASGTLGAGNITDNATLTFNRSDAVSVANAITGTGSIVQLGTGTTTFTSTVGTGSLIVGFGTAVMDTGSVLNTSLFSSIGLNPGDNASATLKNTGTWTAGADINVGDNGTTASPATGTLTLQDSANLTVNTGGFFVGSAFSGSGFAAVGTVNQSGGTLSVNNATDGYFVIGGRNSGSTDGTGTYNLSGGTLIAVGNVWVGGYGTGTLSVTASGQFTTVGALEVSAQATGTGTVNLDGGSITANSVSTVGGTSTFNFNGGTLKAGTNTGSFMGGLTAANVRNNGAVIHTSAHVITISQALVHSGIGGDNATDGGLVKTGSGTLALSNTNTYNGATTVNGGTLVVTGSLAAGSAVIVGGATATSSPTLAGTGTVNGSVTIAAAGGGAAGTVNPGGVGTVGNLATGSATIAGTFACDVSGTTADKLVVTGNLDISAATLTVTGTPTASSYVIATYTGSITGSTFASVPSGYTVTVNTGAKQVILTQTAGYSSWATSKGLTAGVNDGLLQDPNNNGISNLMEYVLNGNPLNGESPSSILPTQSISGTNLVFTFHRLNQSATDTTQVFQYGSDLSGWTPVVIAAGSSGGVTVTITANTPASGVDEVVVTVPRGANTKLFGRLHVTKP